MRTLSSISLIVLAGMLLPGCARNKDPEEQRLSWSTESPLSIPYRVRLQRFERNNLVRNPSFETGRTFKFDSLKSSFVIDAWQQVGQHVEWVDTRQDSLFRADESISGFRAVKVTRTHADETDDQGDGIMSEFIRVIPGNYSLSFFARLANVRSVKGRLGMKVFDAVNIKLLYFDKSKIALGHAMEFPLAGQKINNSFKSLSLANYSSIDSFGWGRINGKSAEFPFPEGDIPTSAHYVKIFIGLKGTGTMWIDSVRFSYTARNFSPAERMAGYTDTSLRWQPFILPTPKKTELMESIRLPGDGGTQELPRIVLPAGADVLTLEAAGLLQAAFTERLSGAGLKKTVDGGIRFAGPGSEHSLVNGDLVFILGNTGLFTRYDEKLPFEEIRGHREGYFIYSLPDMPHVVFLNGNNSRGIYYAALSAVQLIDGQQPVFHNARVVDFPDFENRFCSLNEFSGPVKGETMSGWIREWTGGKINGAFYFAPDQDPEPKEHFLTSGPAYLKDLFRIGGIFREPARASAGYDPVVWAPDIRLPDDTSLIYPFPVTPANPGDLSGGIARSEAVNAQAEFPGGLWLPPAFNNQLVDYSGYGLQQAVDFPFTWLYSGSSFFSLNTDAADLARFRAFCGGRPVFMDNSMLAFTPGGKYGGAFPYYPGKARLFNIFEPFSNETIREQFAGIDSTLFWVNFPACSEIGLIRILTAADFMWNAKGYVPEASLWKVMFSRYGGDAARILVRYADQYALMLEVLCKAEKGETLPRNLKNVQADMAVLSSLADELRSALGPGHKLTDEILYLNGNLKDRLEKSSVVLPEISR